MATAFVNHDMLRWAVARASMDTTAVAERLGVSEDKFESWLSGEALPTFKQAQRLASVVQVPFGFFYLREPPKEKVQVVEFRKIPGVSARLSRDVLDLLSDIEFKRDWYRDYRVEGGFDALEFVGRFDVSASTLLVASDIRSELSRESNSLFATKKMPERFLDELIKAAERIGIWVMRSGVVGNNTHRPISVEELRGFAIADKIVPIVFLNGKDSKAAQIFTLAHELAHIWLGKSSIEFGELSEIVSEGDPEVEKKCNAIAAETLVPSNEFAASWLDGVPLEEQVGELSGQFGVSRIVIARRALEQSLIDRDTYSAFFAAEKARWAEIASSIGGGSYYNNIPSRNGKTFTKAVAREAAIGRLMYRDAGQLLGVQPSKVRELHERSAE